MKLIEIASFLTVFAAILTTFSAANAQENNSGKFVTIAKVKAPAAATDEILKQGFLKAIPTYKNIEGLQFKAFSIQKTEDGNFFGGLYLWNNKETAEKWFSPQWFERVKTTYAVQGTVDYYEIIADKSYFPKNYDFNDDKSAAIFVQDLNEKDVKAFTKKSVGLLRSYFVKTANGYGAILLFVNQQTANLFIEKNKIAEREFFTTPVLLNNVK